MHWFCMALGPHILGAQVVTAENRSEAAKKFQEQCDTHFLNPFLISVFPAHREDHGRYMVPALQGPPWFRKPQYFYTTPLRSLSRDIIRLIEESNYPEYTQIS